jgi:hypothetical protein
MDKVYNKRENNLKYNSHVKYLNNIKTNYVVSHESLILNARRHIKKLHILSFGVYAYI